MFGIMSKTENENAYKAGTSFICESDRQSDRTEGWRYGNAPDFCVISLARSQDAGRLLSLYLTHTFNHTLIHTTIQTVTDLNKKQAHYSTVSNVK